MKRNLLFSILLAMPILMMAQLPRGAKITGNITGTDAITGDAVDVQAWLNDGKTVVLDVFATWCGPCWSFHQTKRLENYYKQYGPEGTDQIRILAIEGDASTTDSDLRGTGSNTIGNWLDGVSYPVIDDAAFNTMLKIGYFPTLYIIRPDGTTFEVSGLRGNDGFWELAMLGSNPKDLSSFARQSSGTFCKKKNIDKIFQFYNMGTEKITSAKFDYLVNGESQGIQEVTQEVGVFQTLNVIPGSVKVEENTDFEFKVVEINGTPISATDFNYITFSELKPVVEKYKFQVKFTTDFYPGETTWELTDEFAVKLAGDTYNEGPEPGGGGGNDANKEFTYDVEITDASAECLKLTITDAYGDGLTAFNSNTHPIPGVEILDANGNTIKPKLDGEYSFTTNTSANIASQITTSVDNADVVSKFNISPNPSQFYLNLDVELVNSNTAKVNVTNMFGQNVLSFDEVPSKIDISTLAVGHYNVTVQTKEGISSKRFIKI